MYCLCWTEDSSILFRLICSGWLSWAQAAKLAQTATDFCSPTTSVFGSGCRTARCIRRHGYAFHFQLRFIKCLDGFGSDHFPLLIELQLEAESGGNASTEEADEEDGELAEETMRETTADEGGVPTSGKSSPG